MESGDFVKQDRVLRLLRALALFQAVPHGMTTRDLAERLDVSRRSAQRDIRALERDLGVPFTQVGGRWKVVEGYWLRPVNFSVQEAVAMLLSARLMLRHADRVNPFAIGAYEKVAAVLPREMKEPVLEAADGMAARRKDPTFARVMAAISSAWAERRKVKITYRMENPFDRVVWPLFLEPNPGGHSIYLLAWDEKAGDVRSYRVERISAATVLDARFDPPLGFSIGRYLAHAWGIWTSEEPVEVVLRYAPSAAQRVRETEWHPSQRLESLTDGGVRLRLVVAEPLEIQHWVLGWGAACEVEAPAWFRDQVAAQAAGMLERYERPAKRSLDRTAPKPIPVTARQAG